jgi:ornithine decarboxylase
VLRIRYSSDKAKYKLGKKFGCDPTTEGSELMKLAKSLDLNVVGVSFHIGSSCEDYDVYCRAIKVSREIFEISRKIGFKFDILDIGGGYPGENFERVNEFSLKINNALDENFPIDEFSELRIFSEPGRYFVESAFTLVAMIHSRKVSKDKDGKIQEVMYYLNEGVYSNFLFIPLGPETVEPKVLSENQSDQKFKSTLWGEILNFSIFLIPQEKSQKFEFQTF